MHIQEPALKTKETRRFTGTFIRATVTLTDCMAAFRMDMELYGDSAMNPARVLTEDPCPLGVPELLTGEKMLSACAEISSSHGIGSDGRSSDCWVRGFGPISQVPLVAGS